MIGSARAPRLPRRLSTALVAAILSIGSLPIPSAALAAPVAGAPRSASSPNVASSAPAAPRDQDHRTAETAPAADAPPAESSAGQPSIVYEEAMAHANDKIDFTPGARVDRGFAPRAGDNWPIDGKAPRDLPSGRASGRAMAMSKQGSDWAPLDSGPDGAGNAPGDPAAAEAPSAELAPAPVDSPTTDTAIPADPASYVAPASTDTVGGPELATGLRRQVFGFLPYWEVSGASSTLNYDVLSTIAYFSVGADKGGNLLKKTSTGA
jgi:hypothetical protein